MVARRNVGIGCSIGSSCAEKKRKLELLGILLWENQPLSDLGNNCWDETWKNHDQVGSRRRKEPRGVPNFLPLCRKHLERNFLQSSQLPLGGLPCEGQEWLCCKEGLHQPDQALSERNVPSPVEISERKKALRNSLQQFSLMASAMEQYSAWEEEKKSRADEGRCCEMGDEGWSQ